MNTKRSLGFLGFVGGLLIVSWAYAEMVITNDGVLFPDDSYQTTAFGNADIIPPITDFYDLGSLNNRWNKVYAADLISQRASISDVLSLGPGSPPTAPQIGDIYVDADTNELCFWNGAWQALVTGIAANCN